MVYHSINRVFHKLAVVIANGIGLSSSRDDTAGLGIQGVEMSVFDHQGYDPYLLEENGYLAYASPIFAAQHGHDEHSPPHRNGTASVFRNSWKLSLFVFLVCLAAIATMLPYIGASEAKVMLPIALNASVITQASISRMSRMMFSFTNFNMGRPNEEPVQTNAPISVPGFYLVLGPDEGVDDDWKLRTSSIDVKDEAAAEVDVCTAGEAEQEEETSSAGHIHIGRSTATAPTWRDDALSHAKHHAYPIHAASSKYKQHAMQVKRELESCADNLLKKLVNQGLEATKGLEFALHDCKAAVDGALTKLYTEGSSAEAFEKPHGHAHARRADPQDSEVSSPSIAVTNNTTCLWDPLKSKGSRDCVQHFCNWTSTSDLHRCYKENRTWTAEQGGNRYLNDSIDDFKSNAPLECNLCLPRSDCDGIDFHCKNAENKERIMLVILIVTLGASFVIFLAAIWMMRW